MINRGVPGMNSAQVRAAIEEWLSAYQPAFVAVWVGPNNLWNRAGGAPHQPNGGAIERLLVKSRLYKILLTMHTQRELNKPRQDVQAFAERVRRDSLPWLGVTGRSAAEAESVTLEDLSAIAGSIQRHRIPFVFLTYPLVGSRVRSEYAWHSKAVQLTAARYGVTVIDTARDLLRAKAAHADAQLICSWPPPDDRRCLFVNAMGPHPTKLVYRFIAESVGKRILDELGAAPAPERGTG